MYVLVGDGESEEGQIWEAAEFASHHKVNNLIAITDWNGQQIDGTTAEVIGPDHLDQRWKAFGWNVIVVENGHDFNEIEKAVEEANKSTDKPTAIIAETVKGKGVSFMENQVGWHGSAPNDEQYAVAMKELEDKLASL